MKNHTVLLCIIGLLFASLVMAQQDRGTIVGTVTDTTGAAMPDVAVVAAHIETNQRYDTVTNGVGQYRVPNLPVGDYRVTFQAKGFKTSVRESVRLSVTDVLRIDGRMEVGQASDSVTVTAEAPLLQTETPEVSTLMGTRQVLDLPLGFSGGREPENFAFKLSPGLTVNPYGTGDEPYTSHINGSPSFSKEVVLDGASASTYMSGNLTLGSPSLEAIEEFKVQTSGMSAEYTRTAGGVFNFVMKSGTNDYHGSAMFLLHNESFDANTFANNSYGRPRTLDRRNNWALSLGGPIGIPKLWRAKDKWFFYAAYEKYDESYGGAGSPTNTVPLPQWYTGDFSNYLTSQVIGQDALGRNVYRGAIYDPSTTRTVNGTVVRDMFDGNIIPPSRISQVSKNLVKAMNDYYQPQINSLVNNSFFPVRNLVSLQMGHFSTKSDFQINSKQRLSGSYILVTHPRNLVNPGVWSFSAPNGGPLSQSGVQDSTSQYVRLAHDWIISPSMMNHVTAAWGRMTAPTMSNHVGENGASVLGISGLAGYNYPEIRGLTGDRVSFPVLGYQANNWPAGTGYQLVDTFTWVRGKHSLKFGLDYRWNGENFRNINGPGQLTFSSDVTGLPGFNQTGHGWASMLLGQVTSASVGILPPTGSQFPMYAAFVQDDWKVSGRLTVNVGLRWDYQPQGTEKYDRLHNFNPALTDPKYGMPGAIEFAGNGPGRDGKRTFYPNCLNCGWGPRIGFAYQLPDSGVFRHAVVRGGYGIFYSPRLPDGWDGVPWSSHIGFSATNTVNQPSPNTAAFNWDSGYPGVVKPGALDPSAAYSQYGPVSWDPDGGRVGYTQQWNFNLQRELPGNLLLDLGYIGTKSTGLKCNECRLFDQIPTAALKLGDTLGQWVNNDASIPAAAKALGARYPYGSQGDWIPMYQTLMPYPTMIYWNQYFSWNSPLGFSNFQAFELQLNKRFSKGLQFVSNYTFSKNLGNISSAFGDTWGMNYGRPMDYYNSRLDKSVLEFDQTHVVKIGASYELPVGRGHSFGSQMPKAADFFVGGWTLQYLGTYQSGQPIGFSATGTPNSNFATNRPLIINPGGGSLLNPSFNSSTFDMTDISTPRPDKKYIITSDIIDPTTINRYLRGNAARMISQLRNFPSYNEDVALHKSLTFKEGMRVQLRVEGFNVFNRHQFTGINTNPASPLFGQINGVSNNPRKIQFGIRADF